MRFKRKRRKTLCQIHMQIAERCESIDGFGRQNYQTQLFLANKRVQYTHNTHTHADEFSDLRNSCPAGLLLSLLLLLLLLHSSDRKTSENASLMPNRMHRHKSTENKAY